MYEDSKYKPLSPWEYFGLGLLFSLPVIGLVFLIIFSLSDKSINRRNFARSYFCGLAIAIGLVVIFTAVSMLSGLVRSGFSGFIGIFKSIYNYIYKAIFEFFEKIL